jgi:hypothetical protein
MMKMTNNSIRKTAVVDAATASGPDAPPGRRRLRGRQLAALGVSLPASIRRGRCAVGAGALVAGSLLAGLSAAPASADTPTQITKTVECSLVCPVPADATSVEISAAGANGSAGGTNEALNYLVGGNGDGGQGGSGLGISVDYPVGGSSPVQPGDTLIFEPIPGGPGGGGNAAGLAGGTGGAGALVTDSNSGPLVCAAGGAGGGGAGAYGPGYDAAAKPPSPYSDEQAPSQVPSPGQAGQSAATFSSSGGGGGGAGGCLLNDGAPGGVAGSSAFDAGTGGASGWDSNSWYAPGGSVPWSTLTGGQTDVLLYPTSNPAFVATFTEVYTPASITSQPAAALVEGQAGSFTVTASGSPTPALQAGSLPAGVQFVDNHNGTGTLSGTPTQTGTFTIPIEASQPDTDIPAVTQNLTLYVPSVATNLPSGTTQFASAVDANGNLQEVAIGGDGTVYHDITGQAGYEQVHEGGQPITATLVAMATIPAGAPGAGDMQLVTLGTDGNIYHTIRYADGSWQSALGELARPAAGPVAQVAISAEPDGATLVAALDGGVPYVDERDASGTWSGWEQVPAPFNDGDRIAIATDSSGTSTIVTSENLYGEDPNAGSPSVWAVTGTPQAWGSPQWISNTAINTLSETWTNASGFSLAGTDSSGNTLLMANEPAGGPWTSQVVLGLGYSEISLNTAGLILVP